MILPLVNASYLIAHRGMKIQDAVDCICACGDHSSLKYFHFKLYIAVPKCKNNVIYIPFLPINRS